MIRILFLFGFLLPLGLSAQEAPTQSETLMQPGASPQPGIHEKSRPKSESTVRTEPGDIPRNAPLREEKAFKAAEKNSAIAELKPKSGSRAQGQLLLQQTSDGIKISGKITGLTPNGKHGFHIHEFGDCSAADASSAGAHFNPTDKPHGAPDQPQKTHIGDLGNVQADAQGIGQVDEVIEGALLNKGKNQILGRALVVHEKEDDLKTQPSGNSGARIACGVITKISHRNTETITK